MYLSTIERYTRSLVEFFIFRNTMKNPSKVFRKRKPTARRAPTKKVSFAVKKYVKSAIHRSMENKYHLSYATNTPMGSGQFSLLLNPQINQGTGSAQRSGNQVSVKSAYINFAVTLSTYNATTNPYPAPMHFRWFLISQRQSNLSPLNTTNFFEVNNSSTGWQGTYLDQLFRVNPEHYKVHKEGFFRLGVTGQSNSFPVTSTTIHDNSKFSITKKLYFNKYINKILKYDDTSLQVLNTNCWLVILATQANGLSILPYIPSYINYAVHHIYEDA